jgi:hypothetical protein
VQRFAAGAVPEDGRLALVGDADGGDPAGGDALSRRTLRGDGELRLPDVVGVVLDPAGLRIVLRVLLLRERRGGVPSRAKRMARELVVPWSSARINCWLVLACGIGQPRAAKNGRRCCQVAAPGCSWRWRTINSAIQRLNSAIRGS